MKHLYELTADELNFELGRAGNTGYWTREQAVVRLTVHLVSIGKNPMTFQFRPFVLNCTVHVSNELKEEDDDVPSPTDATEDMFDPTDVAEDMVITEDAIAKIPGPLVSVEGTSGPTVTDEDMLGSLGDVIGIPGSKVTVEDMLIPWDAIEDILEPLAAGEGTTGPTDADEAMVGSFGVFCPNGGSEVLIEAQESANILLINASAPCDPNADVVNEASKGKIVPLGETIDIENSTGNASNSSHVEYAKWPPDLALQLFLGVKFILLLF